MQIGSFGDIVFEVSDKKILTYSDYQRVTSPRWEEHKILMNKPLLEYEGPGTDEISFSIILSANFGVNPEQQMSKIREFARKGKKALFILNGKPISMYHWVITKVVEKHRVIDNQGNIFKMEVDLSLKDQGLDNAIATKSTTSAVKSITNSTNSSKQKLGTITIIVKSVHIRSGPSVNNKVLGYAFKGDTLTVYDLQNGWYTLGGGKYITASSQYSTLKKG